ncbi:hypothetical protein Lfu02_44270 [Longispora fulva]|uniref:Uncharacterized protein n=1 Tax=Longispora fulva TaxID=619741 RepID=A0A8J7GDW0_9ACTN|nr:hypothetical protein [Longispora fulva]MBG6136884.1 hypothetical protein [Longispora fulva]GIG60055.1 hypothetical protein Lfu02_44270 [Longispora fulva]
MASRTGRILLWIGIPVLLADLLVWISTYYSTLVVWELRKFTPFLAAALLVAACVVAPVTAARRVALHRWENADGAGKFVGTLGLLIGVGAACWWITHTFYDQDRTYAAATRVVTERLPDLEARAPYVVGKAQAGPSLGDVAGDISDVTYLPDVARFATLVEKRGWLAGYEVGVTQEIAVEGPGHDTRKCRFDAAADARIGGSFGHNLGRLISTKKRWVAFTAKDAYVYCDGDVPKVVVPLKRQVGILVVTERPAGVAVYDGRTGQVTVTTDTRGIPGPTYPISLAKRQREATHGLHGFADWWFDRSGWDASDDGANGANESEFTLNRADHSGPVYVTPLTPPGSASSVVAVSTVPAQHSGAGLAPLTVYRLEPTWASPAAIVARIKADYPDACCYNQDTVFEVIPTGGDSWVATTGSEQALRYRVVGNGQLQGLEATCLRTADGRPIRCGSKPAQQAPPPVGDPRTLSNEELADLQRRVAEEVARRLLQK